MDKLRNDVRRKENKLKENKILEECDKLSDEILKNVGVRLEENDEYK